MVLKILPRGAQFWSNFLKYSQKFFLKGEGASTNIYISCYIFKILSRITFTLQFVLQFCFTTLTCQLRMFYIYLKILSLFVGLLISGIVIESVPFENLSGVVFLIAGLICFIPGAYHVVHIILAVRGRRGYDFYNLPLFN